jgi:hypothetical protein
MPVVMLVCEVASRVIGSLTEGGLVSERNVDEAVVGQGAHASNSSALLSATEGTGADEHAGVLAPEGALCPLLASGVPEGLELRGEVAVTCGDTEEDAVKGLELRGVLDGAHVGVLGGCVHLGENFLGKSLGDLEQDGVTASLPDALELSIGLWYHC